METDKRGLVVLATRVAEQLVATALEGLLSESTRAVVAIGTREVKLTITPPPEPRLLGPAKTGKRRGPKPAKKRPYTRRVPLAPIAAEPVRQAPAASAEPGALDLSTRRCRHCKRLGTAQRVPGSDREVKCSTCRGTWTIRFKAGEGGAPAPPKPRGLKAASEPDACRRCDHAIDQHENDSGRCLVPRCACAELYQ